VQHCDLPGPSNFKRSAAQAARCRQRAALIARVFLSNSEGTSLNAKVRLLGVVFRIAGTRAKGHVGTSTSRPRYGIDSRIQFGFAI